MTFISPGNHAFANKKSVASNELSGTVALVNQSNERPNDPRPLLDVSVRLILIGYFENLPDFRFRE
jgi:hypothetical protein